MASACDCLAQAGAGEVAVGLILGSGLSHLADDVAEPVVVPYAEIPGFPRSTVPGHAGNFVIGMLNGVRVGIAQGRFHVYEGYDPASVVLPVRVLHELGARYLIVTNAAGSLDARNPPGTLLAIRDHINLQFASPLLGRSPEGITNPFPDLSAAYDPRLLARLHAVALAEGIGLREGVYAGVLGPSYETRAEIRFLRRIGADAVGMSTVGEVIAAAELDLPVVGISLLTNLAAGLGGEPLTHDEVTAAAAARQGELSRLVCAMIATDGLSEP
ncbi:MAG TPA: purine-nucleoside phosphorylase [Gemmatimonadota bacterium]|nr:purine-nucleoside phosphorylase [Gemmatimonadota bacterium]